MGQRRFGKPMRHPGHDYRAPCSVHVTICAWNHQWLFGGMAPTGVQLNDAGRFVEAGLQGIHAPADGVEIDTYMVMPDHLHAIIHLGTQPVADPASSIPELIGSFKLRVMRSWPAGVRKRGWPRYEDHLWQKTYYDTLIRSERHLGATREYILDNPRRWLERERS